MFKVICRFADLQDNNHVYEVGDEYPRAGLEVADVRIAELAGSDNAIGCPLIEAVGDVEAFDNIMPKPTAEKPKQTKKAKKSNK
jgi:hypothetical protein